MAKLCVSLLCVTEHDCFVSTNLYYWSHLVSNLFALNEVLEKVLVLPVDGRCVIWLKI